MRNVAFASLSSHLSADIACNQIFLNKESLVAGFDGNGIRSPTMDAWWNGHNGNSGYSIIHFHVGRESSKCPNPFVRRASSFPFVSLNVSQKNSYQSLFEPFHGKYSSSTLCESWLKRLVPSSCPRIMRKFAHWRQQQQKPKTQPSEIKFSILRENQFSFSMRNLNV